MNKYWVLKMGCWFDFANGWQVEIPRPVCRAVALIVVEENHGAVLVDGSS